MSSIDLLRAGDPSASKTSALPSDTLISGQANKTFDVQCDMTSQSIEPEGSIEQSAKEASGCRGGRKSRIDVSRLTAILEHFFTRV
jgi:hypothetical protein